MRANRAPRVHVAVPLPGRLVEEVRRQPWETTMAPFEGHASREELLTAVAGCDGVMTLLSDAVDAEFLDRAGPRLKVVANYAVGYDNVDLDAARSRGVVVTNTPGVLDEATADLAFALLLATARRVVEGDRLVRSGAPWRWHPQMLTGLDVSSGTTLGIVGFGRIGLAVARRARAFNMRILATPTRSRARDAVELGVQVVELDQLLEWSDVVSLHCPHTPETDRIIDDRRLDLIGPRGILINTARGGLVDEQSLARALSEGRIAAAGLDVYAEEPQVHPALLDAPNTVLLPHIGSAGARTRERMAELALKNIADVLAGLPPVTPVRRDA